MLGNGKIVPKGSNPNSVTLSPDEKTAYITNGGTNDVAVISLAGRAARGYRIDSHWLAAQLGQRQP
jgi:DNA-binding beta-propeller fold protein YncE